MKTLLFQGKWRFSFANAVNALLFDDYVKPSTMKSVDIIVETAGVYVFVEEKALHNESLYDPEQGGSDEEIKARRGAYRWLKNYLKYKYRDSYLFRHAEGKGDKPIVYICLITNLRPRVMRTLQRDLIKELPVKKHRLWKQQIVTDCHVVDRAAWTDNFPQWIIEDL